MLPAQLVLAARTLMAFEDRGMRLDAVRGAIAPISLAVFRPPAGAGPANKSLWPSTPKRVAACRHEVSCFYGGDDGAAEIK